MGIPPVVIPAPSAHDPQVVSYRRDLQPAVSPDTEGVPVSSVGAVVGATIVIEVRAKSGVNVPGSVNIAVTGRRTSYDPSGLASFVVRRDGGPGAVPDGATALSVGPFT